MPFFSEKKPNAAPAMLNAEKIILLPVNDDCLEWGNFYEEQIQYADNVMKETYPELSYEWENVGNAKITQLINHPVCLFFIRQ